MKTKVYVVKSLSPEKNISSNPTALDLDDMLLTPENIKNMKISSSSKSPMNMKSSSKDIDLVKENIPEKQRSSSIDLLELLAQKTSQYPIDSAPVKERSTPKTAPPTNILPSPSKISSSNLKNFLTPQKPSPSSERWAGAAFFNSPAPHHLPIPSFVQTSPSEKNRSPIVTNNKNAENDSKFGTSARILF